MFFFYSKKANKKNLQKKPHIHNVPCKELWSTYLLNKATKNNRERNEKKNNKEITNKVKN